jgi:NADH-quinone oxidoreductase subunit M
VNHSQFPWLTVTAAVPLVGALLIALMPRSAERAGKLVGFAVALLTAVLAAVVAVGFVAGDGTQFSETHMWIATFGVHYALGVDGIGLVLMLMTAVLTPIVMAASWTDADATGKSPKGYFALILAVEGLALGVFMATDLFLFYILFEATLIPLYFLIGSYGGANRQRAAIKFLVYSLVGGLVLLAGVVGVYAVSLRNGTPSMLLSDLVKLPMAQGTGRWLFVAFFAAFAIKAPMFPVHAWLPDSAAAGTPGTSVMLVSVLDKIGTFGMIRYCLQLFPEASKWATPVVLVLALISIFYGALLAIGTRELPRLVAYTSISHFGIMVLGIFAMTSNGQVGSTVYMVNHGLSTGALFLILGYLIKRRGSARIADYGGVDTQAPVLSGMFLFFVLAGLSLPGLSTFIGEFLSLAGAFQRHTAIGVIATVSIVLAALYMLLVYQRTMTGPAVEKVKGMRDLSVREIAALAPVIILIVLLGFFPKPLIDAITPTVKDTMVRVGVTDPAPKIAPSADESRG